MPVKRPITSVEVGVESKCAGSPSKLERLMHVAERRIVMGMEVTEIASALEISEPTVKRDWQRAKAFLHEALGVSP